MADRTEGRRIGAGKFLAGFGGLVTLAGGIAALLFALEPNWRPCIGGSRATITATVFPGEHLRAYLRRQGVRNADVERTPDQTGAIVSYTVDSEGFRGRALAVKYSVFHVRQDGLLGAVVFGEDRAAGKTVQIGSCSDKGGNDLFVLIPSRQQRYLVLLELYESTKSDNRIDFVESKPFQG